MRKLYTMKNLVKGLMLSVAIALGATTAQAQGTTGTGTGTGTGTEDVKPAAATEFWMGEKAAEGRFYLYNVGANIFVTGNTPSETDINKATLWTANGSDNSFSFTDEKGNLVITMNLTTAEIAKKGLFTIVTKFGLEPGTTKGKGAYKLAYSQLLFKTRYFNVDKDKYTPETTAGVSNDWLFISDTQKNAYTEYVDLFNKAKSYTAKGSKLFESDDVKNTDAIVNQINDALKSYNYNTYEEKENGGKAKLEDAIKAAEEFIKTTTGINEIGSTTDAKVSEIYGVNGARKSQLTKGLNIVKMSDGTVKKVLVK